MKESLIKPDYLFEVSWEVCNLVGGIYTVLSSKAATLQSQLGDNLCFIGPDLWDEQESPYFDASAQTSFSEWAKIANANGLKVRAGRWKTPGNPQVILVDYRPLFSVKNSLYAQMWEWFKVNSMPANGDYDDSCIFAYASALVIESLFKHFCPQRSKAIAHFDEWTTGMGLLYLKHQLPAIATVFTAHATCMGRSIAGNNKPLYDYLHGYFGDQMAEELNMVSKHSVEKCAAQQADCFTTVSSITAIESHQLLERMPLVTPNGFEDDIVPQRVAFSRIRKESRAKLTKLVECTTGVKLSDDAFFIGTAGRSEYKNKGLDVFIDSISELRNKRMGREVVAFIMVPGWIDSPRADIKARMQTNQPHCTPVNDPVFTHALHNYYEDKILSRIHQLNFQNLEKDEVKIIYIPSYLKGDDGLIDLPYYNLLSAMDLTIFPSYYEPWGYTPLESCAFGVPTITTSLSGFGQWCLSVGKDSDILDGVGVVPRSDSNYNKVVKNIVKLVRRMVELPLPDAKLVRQEARKIANRAGWHNFIKFYDVAYDAALRKLDARVNI